MPGTTGLSASGRGESAAAVLEGRYGLPVAAVEQLPIGQVTINYRAVCGDGGQVFVKTYLPSTDLAGERGAIASSARARQVDIPGPRVLPNRDGHVVDTSTPVPLSAWEWMPGRVVTDLSLAQLTAAGDALGRIHALFTDLPVRSDAAVRHWRNPDLDGLAATIDHLLAVIAERARTATGSAPPRRSSARPPGRRGR